MNKGELIFIIALLGLSILNPILLSPLPLVFEKKDVRIFTWIASEIDQTFASWLHELGFTDVIVRYVSSDEFIRSCATASSYNITVWYFVSSYSLIKHPVEVIGYNVVVDDANLLFHVWSDEKINDFLNDIRYLQNHGFDFILIWRAKDNLLHSLRKYDFSGINLDIYDIPTYPFDRSILMAKSEVKSLGIYLWVWAGEEWTWGNIRKEQIKEIYGYVDRYKLDRITVWNGYEDNTHEEGMVESSLYNYQSWWSFIEGLNKQLKY